MKKILRNISLFDAISTGMIFAVLGAMLFIGVPENASAALVDPDDCLNDINCGDANEDTLRDTIKDVLNVLLSFVGIIAVAFLIYAGFLMMTAAGNDEQIESGKKIIIWAAIGIILILFSWVLVSFFVGVGTGQTTGVDV